MPTIGLELPDCLPEHSQPVAKIISQTSEMKKEHIYGEDNSQSKQ
jgi:hypothetical protein